jgi:hypothetical protein
MGVPTDVEGTNSVDVNKSHFTLSVKDGKVVIADTNFNDTGTAREVLFSFDTTRLQYKNLLSPELPLFHIGVSTKR